MSAVTTIQPREEALTLTLRPGRWPALPWRDPHSVPHEKLAEFITSLSDACEKNPDNADMRTCLGIAHAMNFDVYQSMDALEEARKLAPDNFFAQLKYSELWYRLRVMDRAEEETLSALNLAQNHWELAVARRQLSEIRKMRRKGLERPKWTQSLRVPAITFLLLLVGISFLSLVWK
jgi:tetratricopeptide (TPR) repeat protein